jgi:multidrug resistance efflux pump
MARSICWTDYRSAACIVLLLAMWCAGRSPADPPKPDAASLEGRGFIVPVQVIQIGSEIAGQAVEVPIEEGQRVKKGEVLVRLDATGHEIELKRRLALLERARARFEDLKHGLRPEEIKQAEAELRRAEAERDHLRQQVERLRRLLQAAAVKAEELAQAEAMLRLAEAQVEKAKAALQLLQAGPRKGQFETARAEVLAAEADLEQARYLASRTRIVAPVDGTILKKGIEPGAVVNAGAFPLGSVLCEIADLTRLEVEVAISERDIGRLAVGQACEVRTEAFPSDVFQGQVARVLPVLDRARGCYLVRVRLRLSDDSKLRPEMSARVRFLSAK